MRRRTLTIILVSFLVLAVGVVLVVRSVNRQAALNRLAAANAATESHAGTTEGSGEVVGDSPPVAQPEPETSPLASSDGDTPEFPQTVEATTPQQPLRTDYPDGKSSAQASPRAETTAAPATAEPVELGPFPTPEHTFADLLRWSGVAAYAPPPVRLPPPEPMVERPTEPEPEPEVKPFPEGLSLVLGAPVSGGTYRSRIDVTGSVGYEQAAPDDLALPINWRLDATGERGSLTADSDGTFSFSVQTAGLDVPLALTVSTYDDRNNSIAVSLTLHPATGGPNLVIITPTNFGSFVDVVMVEGQVFNNEGVRGETTEIQSLSVARSGGDRIPVLFETDGSFSYSYTPPADAVVVELEFEVADYNGNTNRRDVLVSRAPPVSVLSAAKAEGPYVRIDSPLRGEFYRDIVSISGQVSDDSEMSGNVDTVSTLYYSIPGVTEKQTLIFFADDGSFAFDVGVKGVEGPLLIMFRAEAVGGQERVETVALRDGNRPPEILLGSPADGDEYGSGILVAGLIVDPYRDSLEYGGIDRIEYLIAPDAVDGELFVEFSGSIASQESGVYQVAVPAKSFAGDCRIELRAIARNGNTSTSVLLLHEGESDIPSFGISAGDRSAIASWQELPFAAEYAAHAVDAGDGTQIVVRTQGTTADIASLQNGRRYQVQLVADTSAAGYESVSRSVGLIPMRADTLRVRVIAEFEQIRLSWGGIPGTDSFVVQRSLDAVEFSDVALVNTVPEYIDTDVTYGTTYWYRVRPDVDVTVDSEVLSASPLAVPLVRSEVAGRLDSSIRNNLVVEGGYIVAANGPAGITLIDISVPSAPTIVSEIATNNAHDVAVVGDHVFVADGDRGLRVVNIYNPTEPEIVGFRTTTNAVGIARYGDFVFVADDENGVKVIDVSNPRDPLRVASLDGFVAQDIAIADDLAVVCGPDQVTVIDVSAPTRPSIVGSLSVADCMSVDVDGGHAYVATGQSGLVILDVSNPANPVVFSTIADIDALSVRVAGGFAYVAAAGVGLVIYDVSNPATPIPFDTVASESARDVVVSGAHAYLVSDQSVDVIRTHLFGTSYPIASLVTGGRPYAIAVAGDYAFVAAHRGGLKVIDVSHPAAVDEGSLVAELPLEYAQAVVAVGDLVVAADRSGQIVLVRPVPDDMSDSGVSLQVVGSYSIEGEVSSLAASGSTLFVAGPEIGIVILDGSIPAAPVVIAELRGYSPRDITLDGDRLYVAERGGDLVILDVSSAGSPTEVSRYQSSAVRSVAVHEDSILLVTAGGVEVAQIDSAGNVTVVSTIDARNVEDLIYTGTVVYLADGYRGIRVFSLLEPELPRQASAQSETYAVGLAFKDGYLLVVDTERLVVMEVIVPPWVDD